MPTILCCFSYRTQSVAAKHSGGGSGGGWRKTRPSDEVIVDKETSK